MPVEYKKESFKVTLKGLGGSGLATAVGLAAACTGAMLGDGGAGHSSSPAFSTMAPRVTSSSRLMWKWSFEPKRQIT